MAEPSSPPPLGRQMLRTAGIFQAACALPVTLILGSFAFGELFGPYMYLYDFVTSCCTTILSAGIIFVVLVQRKIPTSNLLRLQLESTKSILATGLWLWLILDSAFGPWQRRSWHDPEIERPRRLVRSAIASSILFILFYPALLYSYVLWRRDGNGRASAEGAAEGGNEDSERTPLLG